MVVTNTKNTLNETELKDKDEEKEVEFLKFQRILLNSLENKQDFKEDIKKDNKYDFYRASQNLFTSNEMLYGNQKAVNKLFVKSDQTAVDHTMNISSFWNKGMWHYLGISQVQDAKISKKCSNPKLDDEPFSKFKKPYQKEKNSEALNIFQYIKNERWWDQKTIFPHPVNPSHYEVKKSKIQVYI